MEKSGGMDKETKTDKNSESPETNKLAKKIRTKHTSLAPGSDTVVNTMLSGDEL